MKWVAKKDFLKVAGTSDITWIEANVFLPYLEKVISGVLYEILLEVKGHKKQFLKIWWMGKIKP